MPVKNSLGENPYFASSSRKKVFKYIVIAIGLVFIGRLAQLQIIEGNEYRTESEAQAIKRVWVEPFRGNMFDRNNHLIVHNEPSFAVTLTPNEFNRSTLPLLSSILHVDTLEILQTLEKYKTYSPFLPIKIHRDADFETVSMIEEYNDFLPGIAISVESKRLYEYDCNMAHLAGYTREISRAQLSKRQYYKPGDVIGQNGLEYEYESLLRGKEGVKFVAVNKFGRPVASFDNGKRDIESRNGFDLILSIDIKLQEKAEKLLEGKRGAVAAIDPKTGEVMILASKPDFDPREFSGRIPRGLYNELSNDEGKPLLHRAIMSGNPPGSIWKMLIALAGLQEGIITPSSKIFCGGGMTFGGRYFKCHGSHGNTDVTESIKTSCNTFFYKLALDLGFEKIIHYGEIFGFGEKTFIDLPFEKSGNYISMESLNKKYNNNIPRGLLLNYGIGQGEILATPIQMASYTATLANNGIMHQPHVVNAIYNNITDKIEPLDYKSRKIDIKEEYFEIIKQGMFKVVNEPGGTARIAQVSGVNVAGKTGTAQNPHGKDHAWFVCFAPVEDPQIAMAVFVENSGFGGSVAAPIARELLDYFFHPDSLDFNPVPIPLSPPDSASTDEIITTN